MGLDPDTFACETFGKSFLLSGLQFSILKNERLDCIIAVVPPWVLLAISVLRCFLALVIYFLRLVPALT